MSEPQVQRRRSFVRPNPHIVALVVVSMLLLAAQIVGSIHLNSQMRESFELILSDPAVSDHPLAQLQRDSLLMLNLADSREAADPARIEDCWRTMQEHWASMQQDETRERLTRYGGESFTAVESRYEAVGVALESWRTSNYEDERSARLLAAQLRRFEAELGRSESAYLAARDTALAAFNARVERIMLVVRVSGYALLLMLLLLGYSLLRIAGLERDARAAQQSAELKGLFVAMVSQELRNPLNAVIGYSDLLIETNNGEFSERQVNYLERILGNGQRLLHLIDDILVITQIEAQRLLLRELPFDPRALLLDLIRDFDAQACDKGLLLSGLVDDDVPPLLVGDPDRLRQVIGNLIDNAIKFSRQGAIDVRMQIESPSGWLISVRDCGEGIPAEELERIFDAFYQADRGPARAQGGSGLGLAIVERLVALMKGQIDVQSSPGQGSVFVVRLPLVLKSGTKEQSL